MVSLTKASLFKRSLWMGFLNDNKLLTARIHQPMIRRQKGADFEIVSWDEAIEFTG